MAARLTKRDRVILNAALALYAAEREGDEEWGDDDEATFAACWAKIQTGLTSGDLRKGWHRDTSSCDRCAALVPTASLAKGTYIQWTGGVSRDVTGDLCESCRDEEEDD